MGDGGMRIGLNVGLVVEQDVEHEVAFMLIGIDDTGLRGACIANRGGRRIRIGSDWMQFDPLLRH